MSFLSHLECGACGAKQEVRLVNLCPRCSKPLLARYDLDAARERLTRGALERGGETLWRFRELLPVADARFETTLGEGMTPLVAHARLSDSLGVPGLLVKEEGLNPTGTFKARGMAVAVSKARELGAKRLVAPSAGNAGVALAAYAAAAGLPADVFFPEDVARGVVRECEAYGARVTLVKGFITDAGVEAQRLAASGAAFDVSTLREPYRVEGKKTMGYELVLQLGWRVPDVVVYPTGGGTGIVGMWKAFDELERLGLIGPQRPRLLAVQPEGCAPIVRAHGSGHEQAATWESPRTRAHGLRVPRAIGDFLILRALRESRGAAVAVSEAGIAAAEREFARAGISASAESGAALAGLRVAIERGLVERGAERIVLFNTGAREGGGGTGAGPAQV